MVSVYEAMKPKINFLRLILFGLVVLINPWWDEPTKLFDVIGVMLLFSSVVSIVRTIFNWPIKGE